METLTTTSRLVVERCITCGVTFAMPEELHVRLKSIGDKQAFYCPNGHSMVFKYSEVEQENLRLKKELEYQQKAKDSLHNTLMEREESIQKLTRQAATRNKRLKAGMCPCCNRTFKELAAHMETKHPDYAGALKKSNPLHAKIKINRSLITK